MIMKTLVKYDYASEMEKFYNSKIELYDRLIKCGIPKKLVHYYEVSDIESGYTMGEKVYIYCNDMLVDVLDQTEEYARSCKWRANHGKVVLRFNKKTLKEYINVLKQRYDMGLDYERKGNNSHYSLEDRRQAANRMYAMLEDAIDYNNSVLHKRTKLV